MEKNNLSPYGVAIEKFKKIIAGYDKDANTTLAYEMMKLIEEDVKKREREQFRTELTVAIKGLMAQYKQLFYDYSEAANLRKGQDEDPFQLILENPNSAYCKLNSLIKNVYSFI
jgi:hypothetical protein